MNFRILQGVAVASAVVFTSAAFAAPAVNNAQVLYSGTYGNGDVFVGINQTIAEPGCTASRVDVPRDSPAAEKLLQTARLARDKGLSVNVSASGCYNGLPTLDNTRNTYFLFN